MEEYLLNEPFKKDEKTKQKFTDALQHCLDLMNENNNIHKNNIKYSSNKILTQKSAIIGHEMYEFFKETMIGLMTKEEIIEPDTETVNKLMIKEEIIEPDTETINELIIKEEIIEPDTEKIVFKRVSVRLERLDPDVIKNLTMKKNDTSFIDDQGKNVELQNELIVRKKTTPALISSKKNVTRTNELRYRKKRVDKGVNVTDEMKKINNWVFKKCLLYKKRKKNLSNELIRKWGREARAIILSEHNKHSKTSFVASKTWVQIFKKKYNIKGRNPRELQIVDKMTIDKTIDCHSNHSIIIPYEKKLKIINTQRQHPDWKINMIKKHCKFNRHLDKRTIELWKEQFKKGGTIHDKMKKINNWVYQKCIEHKKNNNQLKNENIRQFGRQAYEDCFPNKKNRVSFTASLSWIIKFKKSFSIEGSSQNLIITNKSTNDEISDTTEALSKESPVSKDDSHEISVKSNDKKSRNTYDDKIRVIKLARDNPTWTIAMLRQVSGMKRLRGISMLDLWKKQVENGGSQMDKSYRINQWVDNKVNEYKSDNKILTREIIQGFLNEAKKNLKIKNLSTARCNSWWLSFRRKHNLSESFSYDEKNVDLQNNIISCKKKRGKLISQKKKLEIINLVRNNPTWTIRMIQEKSNCYRCYNLQHIKRWITSFKNGGARFKHINIINRHAYRKYIQYKNKNKNITDKVLIKWAQEAFEKYNLPCSKKYKLHIHWLERFKQIYCLSVPTNPNSQDNDDDDDNCHLIKSNSPDISNENYKETNDNTALNFDEIDKVSIGTSKKIYSEDKKKVIYIGVNGTHEMKKINNWVYKKCLLYKKKKNHITNELIKKWGLEARDILLSEDSKDKKSSFVACDSWVQNFKKKYNIKGSNSTHSIISYETKLKIVNTQRENPDWTIDMIKKHCGYNKYLRTHTIHAWAEQVNKGGTVREKKNKINDWVYQKCIEHKKNNNQLSYENIRQFGSQAYKVCFPDKKNRIPFEASLTWIYKFKKSFGIVGKSPDLTIKKKPTNDEIPDTTEAPSEKSPVAQDESDDSSVESNEKKSKVTFDDKIRVIKLARKNPTWTMAMVRRVSGVSFRGITTLKTWKKQIKKRG